MELKRCDCGRSGHIPSWSEMDRSWYIPCKCGLMIEHIDKNKLIKTWNTRKQEITIEELEEIVDNLRYSVCLVDVCKCKVCEIRRKVEAIIERIKE